MSKKVEIILGKDGSVTVEAFGFKGASCLEAVEFLNNLYGDAKTLTEKDSMDEVEDVLCEGLPSGWCG